jgi:tRNA (Thr-GGU) A37 N-methylase
MESAPNQGDEGAPDAWIDFEPDILEALKGINLEALDGTPIVDVKPVLSEEVSER